MIIKKVKHGCCYKIRKNNLQIIIHIPPEVLLCKVFLFIIIFFFYFLEKSNLKQSPIKFTFFPFYYNVELLNILLYIVSI